MNGFWFPWNEGVNGNQPGEFVAAWRHVHDIFEAVGATNATWVWCPNVNIYGDLPDAPAALPRRGLRRLDLPRRLQLGHPARLPRLAHVQPDLPLDLPRNHQKIAPGKPMVIGEIASSDRGGSKAAWIKDMLRTVRTRYRRVRALIWMDVNERNTDGRSRALSA